MKNKFIFIASLFGLLNLNNIWSQENNEAKTLFGGGNSVSTENLGFFVAPSYGFTQIDGANASLFNLRGGLNLKDKMTFGAYFNISLNQIKPQSETIPNIYLDYWTVGGFTEYSLMSKKAFHFSFPLYFGYGEVQMDNEVGEAGLGEANFFQIEPSALLELNLHKYVRFNLGAGYRLVSEMNYRNLNQNNLSGITAYAGFKFGLFR